MILRRLCLYISEYKGQPPRNLYINITEIGISV